MAVLKKAKAIVKKKVPTKKKILLKKKKALRLKKKVVELKRSPRNPIIEPGVYPWESKATFNPAAITVDEKIYLIYRAVGENDSSVLGYALSSDGFQIDERLPYSIFKRHSSLEQKSETPILNYSSGDGWNGGCEDPRLTLIDDRAYMIFTAFDGWGSLRLALTSISLSDLKKKRWNWKSPVLISPPGEIHKNWVLFPEKIKGKYAIMHSFYPKILVAYFDSLDELNGKKFIKSNNTRPVDLSRTWDSWFRGVGPTPIKTKEGWLILYHAMEHHNPDRYRLGALLLDLKDPTKVLYRSKEPILEPEKDYENEGHKWGVIYCCGAVVKDKNLFVYYGGADKVVAVASVPLKDLLADLLSGGKEKVKLIKKK
ncbi:MAG TPA: hypothetical protein VFQ59_02860 [Candidatus Paceibacterota bacterium]|nr:hypothetical protein [Candidatus Paceibacterota bacterium]